MVSEESGARKNGNVKSDQNDSSSSTDLSVKCDKKQVEHVKRLAGVIFMCNKVTMNECFHSRLFGLPRKLWHIVKQIAPGMTLFLFEYESRTMSGIYEATSNGNLNFDESVYSTGFFPAQVRFTQVECAVSLREDDFKDCIRDNYFSDYKFRFDLIHDQVQSPSISAYRTVTNDNGCIVKNIIEDDEDDSGMGFWSSSARCLRLEKFGMNLQYLEKTKCQEFVFQLETPKELYNPTVYSVKVNKKRSVWSRLSTQISIEKCSHFQKNAIMGNMELPYLANCDEDDIVETEALLSEVDEYGSSEEIDSVMQTTGIRYCGDDLRASFKRNRLHEPTIDQGVCSRGKERRKIVRPEFLTVGISNESPVEMSVALVTTADILEPLLSRKTRKVPFEIDLNVCPSELYGVNCEPDGFLSGQQR